MTAHAFKFHLKLGKRLAGCTSMPNSDRERVRSVEANGLTELSAGFTSRHQPSCEQRCASSAGLVDEVDLRKSPMLMAEVHDESRMNFSRNNLVLNFGLRREFTENYILIVSMGHELLSPDQPTALIGYFGMQFVY